MIRGAVIRPGRAATLEGLALPAALHEIGGDDGSRPTERRSSARG